MARMRGCPGQQQQRQRRAVSPLVLLLFSLRAGQEDRGFRKGEEEPWGRLERCWLL